MLTLFLTDKKTKEPILIDILLIDDWNFLMNLSVKNKVSINQIKDDNGEYFSVYATANDRKYFEDYAEHESPQAATRFAIAMALVKLKEVTG